MTKNISDFAKFLSEFNYSGKDSKGNYHYPQGARSASAKITTVLNKKETAAKAAYAAASAQRTKNQSSKAWKNINSTDAELKPMLDKQSALSDKALSLSDQEAKISNVRFDVNSDDWAGKNEPKNYPKEKKTEAHLPGRPTTMRSLDKHLDVFDDREVRRGIEVEKEHTGDEEVAKQIALDHLKEDPHYYAKLKKVEPKESTMSDFGSFVEDLLNEVNPKHPLQDRKERKDVAQLIKRARTSHETTPRGRKARTASDLAFASSGANIREVPNAAVSRTLRKASFRSVNTAFKLENESLSTFSNFMEVYYDTPRYMHHRQGKLMGGAGDRKGYGNAQSLEPGLPRALRNAAIAKAYVDTIKKHHSNPRDAAVASDLGATAAVSASNAITDLRASGLKPKALKTLANYERNRKANFGK